MTPTIKSLITYQNIDKVIKVLCDYIEEDEEYYTIENKIEMNNPFKNEYSKEFKCSKNNDNYYTLLMYEDNHSPKIVIDVCLTSVIKYKNKIFELKEMQFDKQALY